MDDIKMLSTRQIKAICRRNGWHCQMERLPPDQIDVERHIVAGHRYRKNNAVMVRRSQTWQRWQRLGWRWNIETLNEGQITALLKALEQEKTARVESEREA